MNETTRRRTARKIKSSLGALATNCRQRGKGSNGTRESEETFYGFLSPKDTYMYM